MKKIILASASPRRVQLMKLTGLEFEQQAGYVDESSVSVRDSNLLVKKLAYDKASSVSGKSALENTLVIGADTIVEMDGTVLGKPAGREQARTMLKCLSGKDHIVKTGLCILDTTSGQYYYGCEETLVRFRKLEDYEIEAYLDTGECYDKAGAYGIQGKGAFLVEKVEGCYYNVVGLPLNLLRDLLFKAGIDIWRPPV